MLLDLLFARRELSSNLAEPEDWLFDAMGAVPTEANVPVTEKTALSITAVWSAVNTISDTLGETPIKLLRKRSDGTTVEVKSHPALRLIKRSPNPYMVPVVFRSTLQSRVLLRGNGYAEIFFGRDGRAAELWPRKPTTKPIERDGRLWYETDVNGKMKTVPAENMIHVPALSMDGLQGLSIIGAQREGLGHTLAVNKFGSKFFANGARPGGLLAYKSRIKDPEKTRRDIHAQYSGDNAHNLLVTDGDAEYKQFGIPPEDAQFLQTKEFSVDDVGRMFRLPAHFLNKMGQATFNNLEQMGAHFVQYTMVPWFKRWEEELTRKLLLPGEIDRGLHFKFNASGLMRGDIKSRYEAYAKAIQGSWMMPSEARELEDFPPVDGLDRPLVPANMSFMGDEPDDDPDDDAGDDNADDNTDDDAGDDTDDGDEDRATKVVRQMANRLAIKELRAMSNITKRHKGGDLIEAVHRFYVEHEDHICVDLFVSRDMAHTYCVERAGEILATDDVADTLATWESIGGDLLSDLYTEETT